MKGIGMMLKSLGINVDPAEVETLFNNVKVWIPELITYTRAKLESMDSRLATIESRLERLDRQNDSVSREKLLTKQVDRIETQTQRFGGSDVQRNETGGMDANGRA